MSLPLITFLHLLENTDLNITRTEALELATLCRIYLRQAQTRYLQLPQERRNPRSHRHFLALLTFIIQLLELVR